MELYTLNPTKINIKFCCYVESIDSIDELSLFFFFDVERNAIVAMRRIWQLD